MRVVSFGATRGCGLETVLALLEQGGPQMEVHAMVRNKNAFQAHLKTLSIGSEKLQRLHIYIGDALRSEQVNNFIQDVAKGGHIDAVVSSLGVLPVFNIMKPLTLMPEGSENICGDSMNNILNALEKVAPSQEDKKIPCLIVVSSNGMDKPSHDALPWMLRPICESSYSFQRALSSPLFSCFDRRNDQAATS
jgi:NADP-dependent 3-hydroxy acid dehydrogenase YdfG